MSDHKTPGEVMADALSRVAIGRRIRARREAMGRSPADLADAASLNTLTIRQIEAGISLLRSQSAVRLARALNVTTDWLLTGEGAAEVTLTPPVKPRCGACRWWRPVGNSGDGECHVAPQFGTPLTFIARSCGLFANQPPVEGGR